ncbi:UDP-N-acetylmuramoyl-L-alanyl-D-glutamate--2,6-diaminopimelate ligase [Microbispora hainanensis]|jgi:UDP-N-acetylmuramoyl-L-alanyl-D-glutamate--2,6-diaminopimelate ligase|uniref:UDP-N-acetylmuramoyl-L-alanyl-D-glutamate--2, 6-diaminopimelate ligase n=1 Tax=Microbispora TaxID=2005 RepID=UPI00115A77F1|nr:MULTISPECIES: UDP-N-acetylmuramoyl-L-alanyl-D-glutamate--2,6-diaminopimelate ligase [Microbispora]NJP22884.1 UDP-N-acetylmuramoyl-L-alanyl-D-glutamate--2,6-diaminopimelate ligase [Microbispora sp. CL1-1]TQS17126.1 UDP-N-acetylmuramoyl-L-alanyl-D-glutamate--2,6-diaminopimelate ligase [Microbispora sp. SCL1-1]
MRPEAVQARPLSALASLLGATSSAVPSPGARAVRGTVTGITLDSRRVRRGDLYVAAPGKARHGAEFAADALASGATAILTDEEGRDRAVATGLPVLVVPDPRAVLGQVAAWVYGKPAEGIALIGVTGTSGKSTSTFLLEAGLRAAGHRTGLVGGVEIRAGDVRFIPELTTPEATDLQGLFALMRERGVSAAAMEVSSHALALGRVDGLRYDVSIFTNLSQDHLDFHRDLDDYFAAKARLFTPEFSRAGVVNIDDAHGRELAATAKIPITTFSATGAPEADWRAEDVRLGSAGSAFRLVGPGGVEAEVSVALPGPFNVANTLGALVALVEAGVPLQAAVTGVGEFAGVPGRMERVPGADDVQVIVDYAHKPGAVESVLRSLRAVLDDGPGGRLVIVLGCGGDRDRGKRPIMGEAAVRLADLAVFTSDNPRTEDPLAILAAMLEGALRVPIKERAHVIVEPDRAAAIRLAVGGAVPGDVVVVAGKGHEQGQYVGGEVIPFDDREVAAAAIAERSRARRAVREAADA